MKEKTARDWLNLILHHYNSPSGGSYHDGVDEIIKKAAELGLVEKGKLPFCCSCCGALSDHGEVHVQGCLKINNRENMKQKMCETCDKAFTCMGQLVFTICGSPNAGGGPGNTGPRYDYIGSECGPENDWKHWKLRTLEKWVEVYKSLKASHDEFYRWKSKQQRLHPI